MEDYSLGLALFDYLPVALSVLGLYWLAEAMGDALPDSRRVLLAAVCLVAAGGLSKASWKLLWVTAAVDHALLNNLLFILMAPGFVLLACHCAQARRAWSGRSAGVPPLPISITLIIVLLAASLALAQLKPDSKAWFFLLLAVASISNITISCWMINLSWRWNQRTTAALFLLSITLILSLSGLARISAGNAALQWLAEVLNGLAHGSFALAVFRLRPFIPSASRGV